MQPAVRVGLASTAVAALFVAAFLVAGWRPIELMLPGERASTADLVAERIGPEVLIADDAGYDGQLYWATATEFPALDDAAEHVQSPRYRFQRILTPALASVGGDGEGAAVALLVVGVLGAGLGAGALADLAHRHGRPAWVGALFLPALFVSVAFGLSEPAAYGLALLGVALADRGHLWWAAAALSAGCLARESVVLVVAGLGLGLLLARRHRLVELVPLGLPVVVTAGWAAVLASWYPAVPTEDRLDPFDAVNAGPTGLVLALSLVVCGLLAAWWWRDVAALWAIGPAFAATVLVYADSLFRYQLAFRMSAPAYALAAAGAAAAYARRRSGTPPDEGPGSGSGARPDADGDDEDEADRSVAAHPRALASG